jgi:branched-chain amino acid transport system permease protein
MTAAYFVPGLVEGSVWALVAAGLLLTYSTSGVLNLAYGSMAYSIAQIFYTMRFNWQWPGWSSACLCVLVISPLLGVVLWQGIFKRLVGAGIAATLTASIGLAIALPALTEIIINPGQIFVAPGIPDNGNKLYKLGFVTISLNQAFPVFGAVLAAVLLIVLFRFTRAGLKMRAVFDSESVATLCGVSPSTVSTASWALGGALAGLGGILLAPVTQLSSATFIELTVASLAAVLIGGLRSIVTAYIAAIALGVLSSVLVAVGPSSGWFATSITPALPFIAMLVTLFMRREPLVTGQLRHVSASRMRVRLRSFPAGLALSSPGIIALVVLPFLFSDYWTGVFSEGLVFALLFLSFTIALGEAGLISLGQAALVGGGGFTCGIAAQNLHLPILLAILAGGMFAGLAGVVLAAVTSGFGTLEFAIATLAFGLFADYAIFTWSPFVPLSGRTFAPLSLGGQLLDPRQQYYLYGVVLALGLLMFWIYRRTMGAFYTNATRMRPQVAEAAGINQRATRTVAFGLSAFLAGIAGGLLGTFQLHLGPGDISTYVGLVFLAVIVTNGVRSPSAAVVAGLFYAAVPALLSMWLPVRFGQLPAVLFGLGGLALASDPRGVVTAWQDSMQRAAGRLRHGIRTA